MREVLDGGAELEVVQRPQAFDEGPEALLEMHGAREGRGEFPRGAVVRGGEVFEEVEEEAVFVVERGWGAEDGGVEGVEGGVVLWWVGSAAPCGRMSVSLQLVGYVICAVFYLGF